MIISNKNNTVITDITSWKNAFIEVDNSKHWKEGRSAHSLATYFLSPAIEQSLGMLKIKECLNACGYGDVEYTHARIEHESRFDTYRSGRMQDMVIWTQCGKCRIVVCIEAKVDEIMVNKLCNDKADWEATVEDIVENPKNIEFRELAPEQLVAALPDVDVAVINGNYAIEGGLHVSQALAVEANDGLAAQTYGNIIATSPDKQNDAALKTLVEVLQGPEVRDFINSTYDGAVVPLN